jgi:hypothetical protein
MFISCILTVGNCPIFADGYAKNFTYDPGCRICEASISLPPIVDGYYRILVTVRTTPESGSHLLLGGKDML